MRDLTAVYVGHYLEVPHLLRVCPAQPRSCVRGCQVPEDADVFCSHCGTRLRPAQAETSVATPVDCSELPLHLQEEFSSVAVRGPRPNIATIWIPNKTKYGGLLLDDTSEVVFDLVPQAEALEVFQQNATLVIDALAQLPVPVIAHIRYGVVLMP